MSDKIIISYHNELPHGKNSIIFSISKENNEPSLWPEQLINETIGFNIIPLKDAQQIIFDKETKTITAKGVENREEVIKNIMKC